MSQPAVSVLLPTYNRAAYLPRAVESVLTQTFESWELIIIDDGSTDETPGLLAAWSREDRRIHHVRNAGRRFGCAAARNVGLGLARADWVAFLDSDDFWEPTKLDRFNAHVAPDISLIGSDSWNHDDAGKRTMRAFILEVMWPWWSTADLPKKMIDWSILEDDFVQALCDPRVIVAMTVGGCFWPQMPATMVRRAAALAVGGFDERLLRTEDMVLCIQLLKYGRFVYIDEGLTHHDIGGREQGAGDRYSHYERRRAHDRYIEHWFHLRFLQKLPRWVDLWPEAEAFRRQRVGVYHQRCKEAAQGSRPLAYWWHAFAGRGYTSL